MKKESEQNLSNDQWFEYAMRNDEEYSNCPFQCESIKRPGAAMLHNTNNPIIPNKLISHSCMHILNLPYDQTQHTMFKYVDV